MNTKPPIESDRALDDQEVCAILNISKPTRARWQQKHGLPRPAFYVGQRGFIWRSDLQAWIDARPTQSSICGRSFPRAKTNADHALA